MTNKDTKTNDKPEQPVANESSAVKERFPVVAMRLLLCEYARVKGMSGYVRLATAEDEPGTANSWSVTRTDAIADETGKVTVPALIRLTVERGKFARMQAFSDLRCANQDLAEIAMAIRARKYRRSNDPVESAKFANELKELVDKQEALTKESERLAKLYETPNTETWWFPIDCPFKEFPLAPLEL